MKPDIAQSLLATHTQNQERSNYASADDRPGGI